ncbi:MAG TPA: ABC transporter permease subunit [Negativicutes bacterium]|jgi:NitT/TauT family transport system permease protein
MSISKEELLPQDRIFVRDRDWGLSIATLKLVLPAIFLILLSLSYLLLPNVQPMQGTEQAAIVALIFSGLYLALVVVSRYYPSCKAKLDYKLPLLTAAILIINLWELFTLKSNIFPMPYFPSIVKILSAFSSDWELLAIGTLYSLRLWAVGFTIGLFAGIPMGIAMGWYERVHYWVYPVLKVIGPIPAIAWIPIFMAIFPTSFWASVFLIAFGTWFSVTVMTWSGVSNVNKAYFEVAKTMGASEMFVLYKVVLPAALPVIFIGIFKALSISFIALVSAEMLGVKGGLGWYLQWSYGWSQYYKVYASLVVMAILFSSITTVLFKIRDKVLIWQKGLIKW